MKPVLAAAGCLLAIGLAGCSPADQEKAKETMREDARKTGAEAKKAGHELDEAGLTAKVKSKLAADAGLSTLGKVEVSTAGSVVTLSGTVANDAQKKAARLAAAQVDGVSEVKDRLTVQPN